METMKYKLSELLTIKNGRDYKHLDEGCYPVFGSGGLMCYVNAYLYKEPSILLPRKGTLSNIQYYDKPFWTVDTLYYSVIHKQKVNPYYLYKYLRSLDLSGFDSGASIPSMTFKSYYGIKINLPEKQIQNRIASILSSYDDAIENNNKRIAILEKMASELYKEWFVRMRFPGYETAEYENGMPKGWRIERLGSIASIRAGGDRPTICEVTPTPVLSIPVYSNGIENDGLYGYTNKATIFKESITISARGTVGFVCLRRKPYVPIVRLISVEPNIKVVSALFLYMQLRNEVIEGNGTSQQQYTVPMASKKKILVPDTFLVKSFSDIVKNIFEGIDKYLFQNQNLAKQRDLLLPRLMSGKLEV